MSWGLLTHWWTLPQLCLDLVLLLTFVIAPLRRDPGDDQGDGKAVVLLPTPHPVKPGRTLAFVLVFFVLDLLHEGLRVTQTLDGFYASVVTRIAGTVVDAPSALSDEAAHFSLGVRFLVVATIVSLALTSIGPPLARVRLAAQALLYVAVMVLIDAIIAVIGAISPTSGSPSSLLSAIISLFVGAVVLLRMLFVCFALPKPTAHPLPPQFAARRRRNARVIIALSVASIVVSVPPALLLFDAAPRGLRPLMLVALPLPFAGLPSLFRTFFLNFLRWARPADPEPGCITPPVEVIIPAYNEEACIVGTLEAIEIAARRYPGSVRVVLANDGSTDRTKELAEATGRRMVHASLEIIDVRHGGKSATLNAALAECTGGVVIRIDADTLIGEDSILYATRWFVDPQIGIVESMVFPVDGRSVFRKLRLFETLRNFGFSHRGLQLVDGVPVVPGMFTALRRDAVVAIGGFTVGMNGEDADLTLTLGRLGWRSWLDTNVVIGEDVPPSLAEFRSQRIRWNRASLHAFARHSPFRSGAADPRVWFSMLSQTFWRTTKPYRLMGLIYMVLSGVFGGWDQPIVEAGLSGIVVYFAVTATIELVLAIRFGCLRRWPWFVLWVPFLLLKEVFAVECLLSLPARPVVVPVLGLGRSAVRITEPVVH